MTELLKLDGVGIGGDLVTFTRTTDLANWNRYAAVNDEFVDMHMDDDAGVAAGYPGAFGMGNLQWAYLHNVLRTWLGTDGEIRQLSCQFRSPNLKGQTVSARARVTAIDVVADETYVALDVWTENQDGEKLAPGSCVVSFPSSGSSRLSAP
ncbi:hypothetical protein [Nocardia sp. NPDC059239]|uniref:hypothetical protein n=1 Tax=unclassified Nocardia TaxID=2637762 RepID=UPI0036AD0480